MILCSSEIEQKKCGDDACSGGLFVFHIQLLKRKSFLEKERANQLDAFQMLYTYIFRMI